MLIKILSISIFFCYYFIYLLIYFLFFVFEEIRLDISCKLKQKIYMKCHALFSLKKIYEKNRMPSVTNPNGTLRGYQNSNWLLSILSNTRISVFIFIWYTFQNFVCISFENNMSSTQILLILLILLSLNVLSLKEQCHDNARIKCLLQ